MTERVLLANKQTLTFTFVHLHTFRDESINKLVNYDGLDILVYVCVAYTRMQMKQKNYLPLFLGGLQSLDLLSSLQDSLCVHSHLGYPIQV